jgi:hypothetical protein
MQTRQIKFGSTQDASLKGEVFSNAATWGELKSSEQRIANLSIGMSALAKVSKGENIKLTSDSDTLPEGNFNLWFVSEKNNSGL